jgi:hypothetical protein
MTCPAGQLVGQTTGAESTPGASAPDELSPATAASDPSAVASGVDDEGVLLLLQATTRAAHPTTNQPRNRGFMARCHRNPHAARKYA